MKRSVAFFVMASLPSLVHPEQVGRLMYFRGPKAITRFAPVALSSSLSCAPRFDAVSRACTLQLINNVSSDDLARMSELRNDDPRLEFSPLDEDQLEEIHEGFSKMDRDVDTQGAHLPGTLSLSETPYISISFKKSPKTVERILAAYAKDGIGSFIAKFSFDAEHTDDYLEVADSAPLTGVIDRTSGGVKPAELEPQLLDAMHAGGLSAHNLTEAEAVGIAYRSILANFFELTREPLLVPKTEAAEIPSPLVLVDESRSPVRAHCTATLTLKKDAQATIDCREAGQ
jgi:hypothetical protein